MLQFLDPQIQSVIIQKLYRYRHLFYYIIIGFISIIIELMVFSFFSRSVNSVVSQGIALSTGIAFAYYLNVRFNFEVPKPKRRVALLFFIIISISSYLINLLINSSINITILPHELSRLLISGGLFAVFYLLHRRFTFHEYKQVGVAVYAHKDENIKDIWEKVKFVGDFIHIDIVDSSFDEDAPDPTTYRLEAVKAYWPNIEIHTHIMSKTPSKWFKDVLEYSDTVIIHYEIEEDVKELLKEIKDKNKRAGICLQLSTPVEKAAEYIDHVDEIMLLTIPKPGHSGQKFDFDSLERIDFLNNHPDRNKFSLCIDGGVNGQLAHLLQVEKVISGSYVLAADNPFKNIISLQNSSKYGVRK